MVMSDQHPPITESRLGESIMVKMEQGFPLVHYMEKRMSQALFVGNV